MFPTFSAFISLIFFIFLSTSPAYPQTSEPTNPFTNLYTFCSSEFAPSCDTGESPINSLRYDGVNEIYGLTLNTLFSFDIKTMTLSRLHSFSIENRAYGWFAAAITIARDGVLYGVTSNGGIGCIKNNGCGTVFEENTKTKYFKIIHFFRDRITGDHPNNIVFDSSNVLYGTFTGGPSGFGGIFSLNINTNKLIVLYNFKDQKDGGDPRSLILGHSGLLYGTTNHDNSRYCPNNPKYGCGVIFQFDTSNRRLTTIHIFADRMVGAGPTSIVEVKDRKIYGITQSGGKHNGGSVFELSLRNGALTVLHSFSARKLGTYPCTGIAIGPDERIYGAQATGGANGQGALFEISLPSGSFRIIHSFSFLEGSSPNGDLLPLGGFLYGTTQNGGRSNRGTLFRLSLH